MAEFTYQVKTGQGDLSSGIIEASSIDVAVETLHRKGYTILGLEEIKKGLFEQDLFSYFSKPSKKDLVMFTRQLSTLIDASVPLVESLQTLAGQTEKASFKKIIFKIADAIEGGASLSQAFSEHKIFSPFYISLVKSGEASGRMQGTLLYLADYLERSAELTSKIRGALAYPLFILFSIVVVAAIMVTTVLPKLLEVLEESGAANLPLSTRILIFTTNFVNDYLILILIALGVGVWYFKVWLGTKRGRASFDSFKINVSVLGEVIRNFYLARMAETLSTLIKSGVPILESLRITSEVVGHSLYRKILVEAEENVKSGGTISEVFAKYEEIPTLVTSMLSIGEKTGKTDFMMEHIYNFYNSESERAIQNLSQLIEPILVLALGLVVGILVAAILLPIYNLVGVV